MSSMRRYTPALLLLFVGSGGSRSGEFFLPAGLFIDSHDRIYIADQGNSRVQVFQYLRAGNGAGQDAATK